MVLILVLFYLYDQQTLSTLSPLIRYPPGEENSQPFYDYASERTLLQLNPECVKKILNYGFNFPPIDDLYNLSIKKLFSYFSYNTKSEFSIEKITIRKLVLALRTKMGIKKNNMKTSISRMNETTSWSSNIIGQIKQLINNHEEINETTRSMAGCCFTTILFDFITETFRHPEKTIYPTSMFCRETILNRNLHMPILCRSIGEIGGIHNSKQAPRNFLNNLIDLVLWESWGIGACLRRSNSNIDVFKEVVGEFPQIQYIESIRDEKRIVEK